MTLLEPSKPKRLRTKTGPQARKQAAPEAQSEGLIINSLQEAPAMDEACIVKLFEALELVLQLLSLRKQDALLPQVRTSVEMRTGRSLSDARLKCILALAGGMFRAKWNVQAHSIQLEQLNADGEGRALSVVELQSRRMTFVAELHKKIWPRTIAELPRAPAARVQVAASEEVRSVNIAKGRGMVVEGKPSTPASPSAEISGVDRLEALRARARAKHATRLREAVGAKAKAARELALCEDAIALHAIVARLFEKNEQPLDAAALFVARTNSSRDAAKATISEAEVIAISKSQGSMNSVPVRAVLAFLQEHSVDWFITKEGVFNVGSRYLHRLPNGSSNNALRALQEKRRQLREKRLAAEH
jgi:hypothetical protein